MSIKNQLIVCALLYFQALLSSAFDLSSQSFKLEPNPNGMCTTHLKTFSNDPLSQEIYSKVIHDNLEGQIWTLWSSQNDSNHVSPIISFHEICSINIIIEGPQEPEWYRLNQYSEDTLFAFRPWTHSLIIIIRLRCTSRFHIKAMKYPQRLYVHFLNCPHIYKLYEPGIFPNFVFLWKSIYLFMGLRRFPGGSIHNSMKQFDKFKLPSRSIEIELLGPSHHPDNPAALDCLSTRWDVTMEMKKNSQVDRCSQFEFIAQHLQLKFNYFNLTRIYTGEKTSSWGKSEFGAIYIAHAYGINKWHLGDIAYLAETKYTVQYCNVDVKLRPRSQISAWFSPFELWVWIVLLFISIIVSLVLAGFSRQWIVSIAFVSIGSLLRQCQPLPKQNLLGKFGAGLGLLLLFDCMGLHLTWIYENTVTSELISPTPIKIVKDLVDLIDAGFKVHYYEDYKSTPVLRKLFKLPFIARNMSHKFSMHDFVNTYDPSNARYVTESKFAHLLWGQSNYIEYNFELFQRKTEVEECYNVKNLLSTGFAVLAFHTADRENFVKMIGSFREAGLLQFWTDLEKYLYRLVIEAGYFGKLSDKPLELIVLTNLSSLFIFWISLLGFALVVFLGVEIPDKVIAFVKCSYVGISNIIKNAVQRGKQSLKKCRRKRITTVEIFVVPE